MRTPAVLLAAALLLSAPTAPAAPKPINGFAAKVNGSIITTGELEEQMKFRRMMLSRIQDPDERAKQMKELKSATLESLIERELILSEFKKRGGQVKAEMVDEDIKRIIREDFDGARDKFLAELKKQGMTIQKFRDDQEKRIAVRYMRSLEANNVGVATPSDVKKYYDDNPDMFRDEGFIRLRTLTMSKAGDSGDVEAQEKLVNEVHQKLLAGSDFGTLAKTYSIDSAASEGGDRGVIGRDTELLRRDLVALAFQQPTGKVSPIFPDQAFYYIMKVESRQPGKRAPLSDPNVRAAIEKRLLAERRQEAEERWITRLKKTAIIKRYI